MTGWPCCGGPHAVWNGNVGGHAVYCEHYGEGAVEESYPWRTVTEGLKQRPGDQPLPTLNDHPDIQSQVIADIAARRQIGIQRYGTALQPFNGRVAPQDAYEEALDLVMYWKQWLIEREHLLARIRDLQLEIDELRAAQ